MTSTAALQGCAGQAPRGTTGTSCGVCAAQGKRERATEVDHITPHRGRWSLFVDPSNLQSLCHTCHSAKTMRELNASMQENG